MRSTSRIINSLTSSVERNATTVSIASPLSSVLNKTSFSSKQEQEQLARDAGIFRAKETSNAPVTHARMKYVKNAENINPVMQEDTASPPEKPSRHTPSRIADHDKFKFDFRTLSERIAQAQAKEAAPSRSLDLRS